MAADLVPHRNRRYVLEEMDNESLIYRRPSKKAYYLNDTASAIWKLCDGARSVQEIISILVDAFPEAATEVRTDVRNTIDELVRTGAIQLKPARVVSDASITETSFSMARKD